MTAAGVWVGVTPTVMPGGALEAMGSAASKDDSDAAESELVSVC